jgi:hypothetical protein
MHVFSDLRPYICTFASCKQELMQFSSRASWADHEFTEHRVIRSWSCPECPKRSDSEIEWLQHLETCHQRTFLGHKQQVAKKMAYTTQAKPAQDEECPLCQVVLGKPLRAFVKHVGRHMEEIALMALPRDYDEEFEAQSTSMMSEPCSSPGPVGQDREKKGIDLSYFHTVSESESVASKSLSTQDYVQARLFRPMSPSGRGSSNRGTVESVASPSDDYNNLMSAFSPYTDSPSSQRPFRSPIISSM